MSDSDMWEPKNLHGDVRGSTPQETEVKGNTWEANMYYPDIPTV